MTDNLVEGKDFETGIVESVPLVIGSREERNMDKVEESNIEPVDLTELSKEELIKIINDKEQACENYRASMDTAEERHAKSIDNLRTTYDNHISKLSSIIRYYERKLNIIKGIINLEEDEKKEVKR